MRGACLSFLALSCLSGICHGQGADYEIRLHRPGKAGERYHLSAIGHDSKVSHLAAPGREPRSHRAEFSVELEGLVTILEVDTTGVRRAAVRIGKALRTAEGKSSELLPAGATVTELRRGSSQDFELDGRPAGAGLREGLALVLSETDGANDDELFGTAARRRVGERWPVNGARLAAFFSRPAADGAAFAVAARHVTGQARIARLVPCGALDCLQVEGSGAIALQGSGFGPRDFKPERSSLEFVFGGLFPLDAALPPLQESSRLTIRYRGRRAAAGEQPAVTMDGTFEKRVMRSLAPVR